MVDTKVSVLVTFYNQERYVDKALESILMQETEFDYEIIVGDDGSIDSTIQKVEGWMNKYPEKIFLRETNNAEKDLPGGFRASRNRLNLLKSVRGHYFIFLDGDDYFTDKCKLQKQVDILDSEENQDCIACGHNIDMIYPNGRKKLATSEKLQEGKIGLKEYWKEYYIHTDTILVRSEIIQDIPMELLENNFNDNMITFVILQKGYIYYLTESMAAYVQTGDGIWTSDKRIVNYVRTMFLYDLCNIINAGVKKETSIRFLGIWKELYKIRKCMNVDVLKIYEKEALDKDLKMSLKWIRYQKLSIIEKSGLLWSTFINGGIRRGMNSLRRRIMKM